MFPMGLARVLLSASCIIPFVACACIPDYPEKLLSDPAVLKHPSVIAAFENLQRNLSALYINTTRDGLSFALVRGHTGLIRAVPCSQEFAQVHASSATPAYTFNNGTLKNNETDVHSEGGNIVTSDSIFRIISVSKNLAMTSALVVENLLKKSSPGQPGLNLDTPVRLLLPNFRLPEKDWNDGGSEITLKMLASHTAGIARESYSTGFNMVLSTGKADTATIGAQWARASAQEVVGRLALTKLMFAPGRRAACKLLYSGRISRKRLADDVQTRMRDLLF